MPLVGFRDNLIGYEFPPVGLGDALLQVCPLGVAYDVDAGAARLDLACIFRKLILILLGPRGDLLEECLG